MKPKAKRRPRRRLLLVCCIVVVCMVAIALALLIDQANTREVAPTSTPECAAVDPQKVGNMVERGAMVVGCLQAAR